MNRFKAVVDSVYGPYIDNWVPRPFNENKSRYLWTDAYGVCNFLTLFIVLKDVNYLTQAQILVESVQNALGRSRDGKSRLGNATDSRPLLGGLRIGKPDNEGPEMEQDGQYYHYLTKWMFALNRMSIVTGDAKYNNDAVEMIKSIHPHFVRTVGGIKRMFWKLSIDLESVLVNSEGGLDPYDGYVAYRLVQKYHSDKSALAHEINDMSEMVESRYGHYRTNDALDAGEALWLSAWYPEEAWAKHLAIQAGKAVNRLYQTGEFSGNARYRLGFREFGTTIGVQMHPDLMMHREWEKRVNDLHAFWDEHIFDRDRDITPVMYCTSLNSGVTKPSFQMSDVSGKQEL